MLVNADAVFPPDKQRVSARCSMYWSMRKKIGDKTFLRALYDAKTEPPYPVNGLSPKKNTWEPSEIGSQVWTGFYSTVTLLARLRGLSMSHPFISAI